MALNRLDRRCKTNSAAEGRGPGQAAGADDHRLHPGQRRLGPRYTLEGQDRRFLRMNSNSYLSLSRTRP